MKQVHTWSYTENGKWWIHISCGGKHECNPPKYEPPIVCLKCGETRHSNYTNDDLDDYQTVAHNVKFWLNDEGIDTDW